ncbi:MAG: hypothetical protein LBI96_02770 [Odoribacteraceae bacterium]|jgi:hypothetical protein|nr:hypothetical protein [Odoribacteraceae bacterium]
MRVDYIPRRYIGFLYWSENFVKNLELIAEEIHFPENVLNEIKALLKIYAEADVLATDPATRTKVTVRKRINARAALEKEIRQDVMEFIASNRLVNAEHKVELGLHNRKPTRELPPVADYPPGYRVSFPAIFDVMIDFYDSKSARHHRKAPGQHGVEIRWGLDAAGVVDADDLQHSSFDTRPPFLLRFPGQDQGKTLAFALRWENSRGEKGPWTSIARVTVP